MPIKLANNASGQIATGLAPYDIGLALVAGQGATFPSLAAGEYFYATLASAGGSIEIVKVTAKVNDTFTIVRAQEGTTALSFSAGARFELRVTAQSVRDAIDDVTASAVTFTPYTSIASTNVQSAIQEVVDEINLLSTNTFTVEVITATEAQTVFNLSNPYVVGATNLSVYMNGLRLRNVVDYVETNSTRVTLTTGAQVGDELTFVAGREVNDAIGASSVSFVPAGTGAVARTAQDKMRESVSVLDFGAVGDGVTDDTAAIQAAVNSFPSGGGSVYLPRGTYKITSQITVAQNGMRVFGDGPRISQIAFLPTAPATCFSFSRGANVIYNCTVEGLRFAGGTTFKKIALRLNDFSSMTVRDIEISGWTGSGSVGIQTLGRECSSFSNLKIDADLPIQISNNPNYTIDSNEIVWRDLYLIANDTTGPCILADDGVYFSGTTFEGYQSWVHGKFGFYYNNTLSAAASQKLTFRNVWKEQSDDATGYVFYIACSLGNVSGLSFNDCHGDTQCRGYYLRGVQYVGWNNCLYPSTSLEALNVDSTVINMTLNNFHANAGSTATLTGQTLRGSFLKAASGSPFPDFAWYQSSGASVYADLGRTQINGSAAQNSLRIFDGVTDFNVLTNAVATLYTASNHALRLGTNNVTRFEIQAGGSFVPFADNTYNLGSASFRLATTHTVNVKFTPVTVSSLPAAATIGSGARAFVSDATATTFASVVAGGGANAVPVYSDGTNWRIG